MDGMSGQVVVVTGGNAGTGKETAVGLATAGATVVITARDVSKGAAALREIRQRSDSDAVDVLPLDLASFASIRSFAGDFLARHDRLDVLVNNAGLMLSARTVTEQGYETTFGVNHLGHFLLTDLLLDRVRSSAPSRIVVVSSHAHRGPRGGLDFDDLQWERRKYRGLEAYGHSKLANVHFTRELARRLEGTGVTVNALHPGFVRSQFGREGDAGGLFAMGTILARPFAISPRRGARTAIYLASSPDAASVTGGYFFKCRPAQISKAAADDAAARRLWEISETLIASAGA